MKKNTIRSEIKQNPKRLYVARKVERHQSQVSAFLDEVGDRLGGMATISTISSTHLTFLETGAVKGRHTPREMRLLASQLQAYLDDKEIRSDKDVYIDPDEPLIWRGGRLRKLALNILIRMDCFRRSANVSLDFSLLEILEEKFVLKLSIHI